MDEPTLDSWLASLDLAQFTAAVKQEGYTTLRFLKVAQPEDIDEMMTDVQMKKPHKRMFKAAWQDLLQQPSGGASPGTGLQSPSAPASPQVAMAPEKFISNGKLIRMGKPEDATHGLPVLMGVKGEPLFA